MLNYTPYSLEKLYLLYYAVKDNMWPLFQGTSGSTIKFLTKRMIEEINVFVSSEEMHACCPS